MIILNSIWILKIGIFSDRDDLELHTFVDALKKAYAAVVYLRNKQKKGYKNWLIISKNRIRPAKDMIILRLELIALLISVGAMVYVQRELQVTVTRRFIWCDSNWALHWLKTIKILPMFVSNQIEKIKNTKEMKI